MSACAFTGQHEETLRLTVRGGGSDRTNVVVIARAELPDRLLEAGSVTLADEHGRFFEAQVAPPGILDRANSGAIRSAMREIHFVLPALRGDEALSLRSTRWTEAPIEPSKEGFDWTEAEEGRPKSIELRHGARPVLQYMHEALDESSPQRREETYKVFHHLYDPSGRVLLTKGAGGKYTHHRGIFYGFNKITYGDGKECDVWHCKGKAFQSHLGYGGGATGAVMGRHDVLIDWHGAEGEVIAREAREISAWNLAGGILIGFHSVLSSQGPKIHLDGDPQHAGFHFRAAQEVAESTAKETYYLRPDGKGAPGETRNWPDQPAHVNLPWDAMSFVVGGKRYTVLYMDHPDNPKEARFSERDYGRFGSYFTYDLDPADPARRELKVRYRLWVQEGEMTVDQANTLSADFVNPVKVTAEWK